MAEARGRDWALLHQALAALPSGSWTTYLDLAELIGSHPVPVGVHIARVEMANGHRAMTIDGTISEGFRGLDPDDTRDPQEVLEEEGVRFVDGRADPAQRMTARDLAVLVGLGEDEDVVVQERDPDAATLDELDKQHRQFVEQPTDRDGPAVAGAVSRLLDEWRTAGGELAFGRAATTSCFPTMRRGAHSIWPVGIIQAAHRDWLPIPEGPSSVRRSSPSRGAERPAE